jgi:hypothetical protein
MSWPAELTGLTGPNGLKGPRVLRAPDATGMKALRPVPRTTVPRTPEASRSAAVHTPAWARISEPAVTSHATVLGNSYAFPGEEL